MTRRAEPIPGCPCNIHLAPTTSGAALRAISGHIPTSPLSNIPMQQPCQCTCDHTYDILNLISHIMTNELQEGARLFNMQSAETLSQLTDIRNLETNVQQIDALLRTKDWVSDRFPGDDIVMSAGELTPIDLSQEIVVYQQDKDPIQGRLVALLAKADSPVILIKVEKDDKWTEALTLNRDQPVTINPKPKKDEEANAPF